MLFRELPSRVWHWSHQQYCLNILQDSQTKNRSLFSLTACSHFNLAKQGANYLEQKGSILLGNIGPFQLDRISELFVLNTIFVINYKLFAYTNISQVLLGKCYSRVFRWFAVHCKQLLQLLILNMNWIDNYFLQSARKSTLTWFII